MAKKEEKEVKKPVRKKTNKVQKEKVVKEEIKKEVKEVEKEPEVKTKKVKTSKKYNTREAIIIMILSLIIGGGVGSIVTRLLCDKKNTKELRDFNETYTDVMDNYYGTINKNDLVYSSITGLLSGLHDRYATYNTDINSIISYEEEIEGKFTGLGVLVSLNESGQIKVMSVYEDSPASKAGVLAGDTILKMNDKVYDSNNYSDFSYNIKTSSNGTKVNLEIMREDKITNMDVELDTVEVESVYYTKYERNEKVIGLFAINNFADNTYDQFVKKYNEAVEDGIQGIIIDVRCNSEGSLDNAAKIASLFLDKGTIIYQKVKDGKYEEIKSEDKKTIDLPVVLIINGGTISTGEMLVSSLNENLGALVVGTHTYGKGYIQKMLPLSNGKSVRFTTEEWVTANKNTVEGVGIEPTYIAKCEETCESNVEFDKALEVLVNILN